MSPSDASKQATVSEMGPEHAMAARFVFYTLTNIEELMAEAARIVLVVENDVLLRMDAVDMIEDAGFKSLKADNADEALKVLETHSDIAIVFTDVQMPGSMNGLELAATV